MMFLLVAFSMVACKKEKIEDSVKSQVQDQVTSGQWRITQFVDSDEDETSRYLNYQFVFSSNGSLSATNGTTQYSGTWNVSDSNSNDDSSSDVHFNIQINTTGEFADVNDDWHIVSQSNTKIVLTDVSGGNGGTDHLVFEKN